MACIAVYDSGRFIRAEEPSTVKTDEVLGVISNPHLSFPGDQLDVFGEYLAVGECADIDEAAGRTAWSAMKAATAAGSAGSAMRPCSPWRADLFVLTRAHEQVNSC
jgi:hypothetical protein